MSNYRVEWACCGSVTETDGWAPDSCPFCTDNIAAAVAKERERICNALPGGHSVDPQWVADMVRGLA